MLSSSLSAVLSVPDRHGRRADGDRRGFFAMDDMARETVLFVDDEDSILNVAAEFFQRRGYRTLTAKNGVEALKILDSQSVDCCFTDINMPQMNGLELADKIRSRDNTLPVIIMTGFPSLENTIQTIKNGVVDFLIKPVNLKQMELCLRRVIKQRELFVENILLKKEIEGKARLEKLNRELLYKVEELGILNGIMSGFAAIDIADDVFQRVVSMAREICHADQARFYVINEAVQRPVEVAFAGQTALPSDAPLPGAGVEAGQPDAGLVTEVAADGIPLLVSEGNGSRRLPRGTLSTMVVPLKIKDKVFGVLTAVIHQGNIRFSEKDLFYLSFLTRHAAQTVENQALYENIYENLFATLYAFVKAVEARDLYTRQHSSRVTGLAIILGQELGCSQEELDILNFAGHLHDIGKIGIRDEILLKPGRLTPKEFEKIKEHPAIGASILEQLGLWEKEKEIIRHHHERFDGSGYPDGLKGEEIPFLARILSVADVYDAVASDRAYRKKMEEAVILKIMAEGAGTQFDPRVVAAFQKVYRQGIILEYMQTGKIPE